MSRAHCFAKSATLLLRTASLELVVLCFRRRRLPLDSLVLVVREQFAHPARATVVASLSVIVKNSSFSIFVNCAFSS